MSENTPQKPNGGKNNNNSGNNRNKNGNFHKKNNYYRHNKYKNFNKQAPKKDPAVETIQDIQADMKRISKEIDLEIKEIGSMTLG